jgi:hypothetical protein
MVCLDVFFVQGVVSSIVYQSDHGESGPSARHQPGAGAPRDAATRMPRRSARPPAVRRPLQRRHRLACGVVTLAQTPRAARLVSVTPWTRLLTVRRGPGWLRVDLADGTRRCRLVASWRDRPLEVRYDNDA